MRPVKYRKIVSPGTGPDGRLFLTVELRGENEELSICGVEGPTRNGDAKGIAGQCVDALERITTHDIPLETIDMLGKVWKRWHLNTLRAGTPAQEQWIRANPVVFEYPESHYEAASQALADAGLNPDGEYKYGHAWLTETLPDSVIEFVKNLPAAEHDHPWGDRPITGGE